MVGADPLTVRVFFESKLPLVVDWRVEGGGVFNALVKPIGGKDYNTLDSIS